MPGEYYQKNPFSNPFTAYYARMFNLVFELLSIKPLLSTKSLALSTKPILWSVPAKPVSDDGLLPNWASGFRQAPNVGFGTTIIVSVPL